jgi:hypothetical protein
VGVAVAGGGWVAGLMEIKAQASAFTLSLA